MAWCCFEALGFAALVRLTIITYACDLLLTAFLSQTVPSDTSVVLLAIRLFVTPSFFLMGHRIWRARVQSAEARQHREEGASHLNSVNGSTNEEIKEFLEYQRHLHAVKDRAGFIVNCFTACGFIVQTSCAVYIGIKSVALEAAMETEGVCFVSLIALINLEYFLLSALCEASTEEHGEALPELHLHPVFFTTEARMHRCDVCSDRIKEEAYRCRTCDFDLCLKCYKRRHRNTSNEALNPRAVSLSDFFMRSLKLSLSFWPMLLGALIAMVACQAVSLLTPSVQGRVFDSIIRKDRKEFSDLIIEYIVINIMLGILASLQSLSLDLVGRRLNLTAREQLFRSIIRQDVAFIDAVHTGILTSRLNNDVSAMVGPAKTIMNDLIGNTLLLIGGAVMCLITDWRLTVLALTSVTPITYAYNVYYKWSRKLNRTIWSAYSDANEVATEAFSNFRTVRAFGAERIEISRFQEATQLANQAGTKAAYIGATVKVYSKYVDAAATVLVLWFGGKEALDNAFNQVFSSSGSSVTSGDSYGFEGFTQSITLGKLIAFQLYWNILNNAFNSLSGVFGDLISASSAAERVYSVMDSQPTIDQDAGIQITDDSVLLSLSSNQLVPMHTQHSTHSQQIANELRTWDSPLLASGDFSASEENQTISCQNINWSIDIRNVSFFYKSRPSSMVLDSIDLKIPCNSVTALVGKSGSGKSTLMHLLLRLYDPTSGTINLSNRDLRDFSASSVRKYVGLVAQDTQLFAASVFKNIIYGIDRRVTFEEVKEAAVKANAHEFICELEEGYETKIGEKGVLLSGGQRQRLAIARCFLRKPKLLLLDEATSALDSENESLVQAAIDNLISAGGCTVVLIAHRLSTVMNANQIAVMNKGRIVETGTHTELLNKGGVYSLLVKKQLNMEKDKLDQDKKGVSDSVDKLFESINHT